MGGGERWVGWGGVEWAVGVGGGGGEESPNYEGGNRYVEE